jgi:hypothetical protein
LRAQCGSAVRSIEAFRHTHNLSLPTGAKEAIDKFLQLRLALAAKEGSTAQRGAWETVVGLAALEAQIAFILRGREEQIRSRTERALMHLQQVLAVDSDVQSKWKKAFDTHELVCEKLGATHLLWHGVFAFKVDATGARSDLVLGEFPNDELLARSVEGLVLTEWKLAKDADRAVKAFAQARAQAELYKKGPLAGIELTSVRYLIVVSLNDLQPTSRPADDTKDGVLYRHVNLVIKPATPSVTARRLAGAK